LRLCKECKLIYSDVLLNKEIIKNHFEVTYKDTNYFRIERFQIYLQIAKFIKKNAPAKSTVIDIGGAKGHLISIIKNLRPDIEVILNDLSKSACDYVREKYRFDSICCSLRDLKNHTENYDFAILADVLYYEPEINEAFNILQKLIRKGLIIRIPNKLWLIKFALFIKKYLINNRSILIDNINYFNPEHIYIFHKKYLYKKLSKHGFSKIKVVPSKGLLKGRNVSKYLLNIFFKFAMFIYFISFRTIIITPSQLIYAQKE
jgi:ubiquinone/menaquinone biosynthesis C-methylase UbiE